MYKNLGELLMHDEKAKSLFLAMGEDKQGHLELHASEIHSRQEMLSKINEKNNQ